MVPASQPNAARLQNNEGKQIRFPGCALLQTRRGNQAGQAGNRQLLRLSCDRAIESEKVGRSIASVAEARHYACHQLPSMGFWPIAGRDPAKMFRRPSTHEMI